jgi:hypothetical protein
MTNQAFSETLQFTRCNNWNTDSCPHTKTSLMQLSIINQPHFWLLDDKTVESLNGICDDCAAFMKK